MNRKYVGGGGVVDLTSGFMLFFVLGFFFIIICLEFCGLFVLTWIFVVLVWLTFQWFNIDVEL